HCWNSEQCQTMNTGKCHKECLGCSQNNSEKHCWACRNYDDHGTCVEKCPTTGPIEKYTQTTSSKCVTADECNAMNGTWWIFRDECVDECPSDYEIFKKDNRIECTYCGNNCTKECNVTAAIDSLGELQSLKGCTHIKGALMIRMASVGHITEQVIVSELPRYLLSVRYISDYLVVSRTNSLQSLDFLANLREIGGEVLENGRFAMFFLENKNLQRLWDFDDRNFTLKIKNGTLGFFSNPQLCTSEIAKLANHTGISSNFSNVDVFANGDKSTCDFVNMTFTVTPNITNATLELHLPPIPHGDRYIGFTVYFIDHEKGDISTYESQNVCDGRGWKSVFTSNISIFLANLQPYTRYAFYIKIYQSSMKGAQTPVGYFRTLPCEPDEPMFLEVAVEDHQSMRVKWAKPKKINGILSHYQLYVVREPDIDLLSQRDYCLHPRTEEGNKVDTYEETEIEDPEIATRKRLSQNCTCLDQKKQEATQEEVTFFSWDGHLPLCDVDAQSKFGFDSCKHLLYKSVSEKDILINKRSKIKHNTVKKMRTFDNLKIVPSNFTKYKLKGLEHYTLYVLYLAACNEGNLCGSVKQEFARTKKLVSADDVVGVVTKVENSNVLVEWVEPKNPNGVVLSYNVEYKKIDVEHSKPLTECLSRKKRSPSNKLNLNNLLPGNYVLRVQAVSPAGYGRFSQPVTFAIKAPDRISAWIVPCISVMNHGRNRVYNPPALGMGAEEHDLYGGHYNVSDEEVSLHIGDSSNRPRFLPASISQRVRRFSPGDLY
ncbi:hypothetical protein NQ315_007835, partial [Exocentrus adspersus]